METYYQRNKEKCLVYAREYNIKNKEKRKAYRISKKDKIRQYYINWYAKNGRKRSDNIIEKALEWQQAFPERFKIHRKLQYAVLVGKVTRPPECSKCGREARIQSHHFNYDHFMNFIWLCSSCHKIEHNNLGLTK